MAKPAALRTTLQVLVLQIAGISRDIFHKKLTEFKHFFTAAEHEKLLEGKWSRRDSNPLPFDCQSNVLPSELRPHKEHFQFSIIGVNRQIACLLFPEKAGEIQELVADVYGMFIFPLMLFMAYSGGSGYPISDG